MKSMPDKESPAEQLYSAMIAETENTRKQDSIKNVWTALEHMRQLGSLDFSVANVARAIENLKLNGPREQTIRNREGELCRTLIHAYAVEHGVSRLKEVKREDDIVALIDDKRTAALVSRIIADNKSQKFRIDLLKKLISDLQPVASVTSQEADNSSRSVMGMVMQPQALISSGPTSSNLSILFEEAEVAGVRMFLENLEDLDLVCDPTGAILHSQNGRELAPPGFLQSLRKIALPHHEDV